jgi:hypothetical protein
MGRGLRGEEFSAQRARLKQPTDIATEPG